MRKSPRAWRLWALPGVLTSLILKDGSYIDTQSSDNVCESI